MSPSRALLSSTGGGWPTRRLATLAALSKSVLSCPGTHDGMIVRHIIRSREGPNNGFKMGFFAASCVFRAWLSDERSQIVKAFGAFAGWAAEP